MSKENPRGVRLTGISEATAISKETLRGYHDRECLPFFIEKEEGKRALYTGAEAFAFAIMNREIDAGFLPSIAASRVINSNCVKEFLWRRDRGAALGNLWLVTVREREIRSDGRDFGHVDTGSYVVDGLDKLALFQADRTDGAKRRIYTLHAINLWEAYLEAEEVARRNGYIVDGWDLYKVKEDTE